MKIIKLIHWNKDEILERQEIIASAGFKVDSDIGSGVKVFKDLADDSPAAIVIDLSRLPSQGRDFGLMVRQRQATRQIPLLFVGGHVDKVKIIKELLPDAVYTSWEKLIHDLKQAIQSPPAHPIYHESAFAGYAGKSLVEKLGIQPGKTICLISPPEGFIEHLGKLPAGVKFIEGASGAISMTIYFCKLKEQLERDIPTILEQSQYGPIWIAWPKRRSKLACDLSQQFVRQIGLDNHLVDYKICSIDETWSGLLFKNRAG